MDAEALGGKIPLVFGFDVALIVDAVVQVIGHFGKAEARLFEFIKGKFKQSRIIGLETDFSVVGQNLLVQL